MRRTFLGVILSFSGWFYGYRLRMHRRKEAGRYDLCFQQEYPALADGKAVSIWIKSRRQNPGRLLVFVLQL